MERVRVVNHKGKQVLILDLSGCNASDSAAVLVEGRKLVQLQAPGTALTLTDVSDAHFDETANREAQTNAKVNAPHVKAAALVGVKGLRKIVFDAITRVTGRAYVTFESRERALDWLAMQ
jgi:hypothetical protein